MANAANPAGWPQNTEMARRIVEHDWAATPLGPLADWPAHLKSIVGMLLGNAFPMTVLWGPELVPIYNDACLDVLGESHSAALGRPNQESGPNVRAFNEPIFTRVRAGETVRVEDVKFRLTRHGGIVDVWFTSSYSPLYGEAGEVAGILVTALETTTRARAEAALRESQAKQVFLLALEDALRPLTDATAIQQTASQLLGEHLGASRVLYADVDGEPGAETGEMRGQYVAHGEPAPQHVRFADWGETGIVAALRRGESIVVRDCATDPRLGESDRATYRAGGLAAVIATSLVKGGRWVACFGAHSDVPRDWTSTELALVAETAERTWAAAERARAELARDQAELALRQALADATEAREEAERANASKDDFLATLGHELRTPLAAISLWIGAVRSAALGPDDLARAIEAIADSAESQSRLVDDLMDLSRLTLGRLSLRTEPVDVGRLIEDLAAVAERAAKARGLALTVEAEPELGSALLDGERLKQIVWNLLNNAMKFTAPGGSVTLAIRCLHSKLEIEVRDSGAGISPEFLPRIFERFSQAETGVTRRYDGMGIGLALAKELVELHGGEIRVASAGVGQGAAFRVTLPWVEPSWQDGSYLRDINEPHEPSSPAALHGLRLLLVEDEPNTLQAMRWVLERAGANVSAMSSVAEAVASLASTPLPDVVISDLALPDLPGPALLAYLDARAKGSGLPRPACCAVSALAHDVDQKEAIDAGFDLFLRKPVAPERLIHAIAELYNLFRPDNDAAAPNQIA